MSYQSRELVVEFQLFDGTSFDKTGDNTLTASGLRVSATVQRIGVGGLDNASITVWGLPPATMNALSTLGKPLLSGRNNLVTLSAGTDGQAFSTVYIGAIQSAFFNGANQPDVGLVIQSCATLLAATQPVPPSSFSGSADVATIISGLAVQAGAGFQNFGVTAQLNSPYLHGSALDQAKQAAKAAGISFIVDNNVWTIWPQGGANGALVPLISPDTGLVGYPAWTDSGIVLTTLYNPQIRFGQQVQVKSSIQRACGTWYTFNVTHELESQIPNGKWFTTIECSVLGANGGPVA